MDKATGSNKDTSSTYEITAMEGVSVFQTLRDEFNEKMSLESQKYPYTTRERIMINTIDKMLEYMNRVCRSM